MKTKILSCALLLLALPFSLLAAEVSPGDTVEAVHAALGVPRGKVRVGTRDLFYYDRGEVELRDGVVRRVALRSMEDQAALETRQAAAAVRLREAREIRLAQLNAEGNAIKARTLADSSFRALPLSYQVAFWEDFSTRYFDVPSGDQLREARARLAEQNAVQRMAAEQTARMAELEAHVAETEAQLAAVATRTFFAGGYGGYYRRYHDYRPVNSEPIKYRFYESPLPYATSPGMPIRQPVYRNDPAKVDSGPNENNPPRNFFPEWRNDSRRDSSRYSLPGSRWN